MDKVDRKNSIISFLCMNLIFWGLFKLVLFYNHKYFWNFLETVNYFDTSIYTNIAVEGYRKIENFAFYPLWPFLIRLVSSFFSISANPSLANLLASSIFTLLLPMSLFCFRQFFSRSTGTILCFCFVLSPLSIFHIIGYAESLYSLLSILWFIALLKSQNASTRKEGLYSVFYCATLGILIGFTRPIFLQLCISIFLALFTLIFFDSTDKGFVGNYWNEIQKKKYIIFSFIASAIFSGIGCLLIGVYCKLHNKQFLIPFTVQRDFWFRKIDLYWNLLLKPQSLVRDIPLNLFLELQAFWLPFFLLMILIWHFIRNEFRTLNVFNILVWISVFYCCIHCLIQFLTFPVFFSHARFIFATPFFYIALGGVVSVFRLFIRNLILGSYAFFSVVMYYLYLHYFINNRWIG